jgi:hypothetical protein
VSGGALWSDEEAVWVIVMLLIASDDVRIDVFRQTAIRN